MGTAHGWTIQLGRLLELAMLFGPDITHSVLWPAPRGPSGGWIIVCGEEILTRFHSPEPLMARIPGDPVGTSLEFGSFFAPSEG
jgi:hypothetical protein